MMLTFLGKKTIFRGQQGGSTIKDACCKTKKWVTHVWYTVARSKHSDSKWKDNRKKSTKHHPHPASGTHHPCNGLIWLQQPLAGQCFQVYPYHTWPVPWADSTQRLQLSSSNSCASGTSKILGCLLQLGCHFQCSTEPTLGLLAGNLTLLCVVWPQQISGTLGQAHINPQRACKQATCGQCCFLAPFLPKLPLEYLPAESGETCFKNNIPIRSSANVNQYGQSRTQVSYF